MNPIKTRLAIQSLREKGFKEETKSFGRKGGKDHRFYYWYNGDQKISRYRTKISHSDDEIDVGLLGLMKLQLGLNSTKEVFDLLVCPMDRERYIQVRNP